MAIPIGTISYGAAAVAFLFLSALLLTSWRGRLQGMLLALACVVAAGWAAALAYLALRPNSSMLQPAILEILRSGTWFAFLVVLLGYSQEALRPVRWAAVGIAVLCAAALLETLYSGGVSATRPHMAGIMARLVLAVVGMVLVEQLFRNARFEQRWAIKFLCLGLGGMFAFDFYLYSETLLFRHIDETIWAARGIVNALVVPLVAVATARNPKWSLDVAVSRNFVFHSTAMLGASVYLVAMAAVGYYLRYFGGTWGAVLQVTCLFGAVVLLFAILFSGTFRARLKVFLSKNFFSYRYDYREEWLRFTRRLSEETLGTHLRERSIEAIAELVDSPGGALWLAADSGAYERVAHWNMPLAQGVEGADGALCQFLQEHQWVIDLAEYETHAESYENLSLPEWLQRVPRAWLVVPLMLHEKLLGFVVLARSKGSIKLNWEVNDVLKTAGRQAASYLAQFDAAKALLVARQFESFNRMSAFVVHDLKNIIAQLALLLSNADKHKHNLAFQDDMMETVTLSVEKMKRLLAQLRGAYTLEPPAPLVLAEVLQQAVDARSGLHPAPRLVVDRTALAVLAHRARLERVIGHLIQNAIEATPPNGSVAVRLAHKDGMAVIEIDDTGCGMSDEFVRLHLFAPFESTKSTGMGVGAYESRQYVRELGGRIEVDSSEGHGTTVRVMLPVYVADRSIDMSLAVEEQT